MTILSAIRDRVSPSSRSESVEGAADGDALPFAGYDRLDGAEVVKGLRDHSQIELQAVEDYERSHKGRRPVLNKLRYMRGREPIPGYDALSTEQIVTALEDANLPTITRIRGYEQKFGRRHDVLEEVARAHHRHQATHPAAAAPAYRSASATSAASPRSDRTETSDQP